MNTRAMFYRMFFFGILLFGMPSFGFVNSENTDIVIRHDKDDSEYQALGAKFPAVCKVGKRGGDGTLIAENWVITAGHVAEGMFRREGLNLKIFFANSEKGYAVDKIFVHPNFAPMQGADIALIRLKESVTGIEPAKLYKKTDETGKPIIIVGHGDFKTGQETTWAVDGVKRGATNVVDRTSADKIIFDFDAPPGGTRREGTAGRGDSGGPAFIMEGDVPLVAGISSAGMPGKNGPGTYGAVEHYTRVSAYMEWIEKTITDPKASLALSKNSLPDRNKVRRGGNPTVRRPGGPLEGLGLMLMQDGDRIRIGGKADPLVPEAFRQVMFKPPSYIKSFNGKTVSSLDEFRKSFKKIPKGDSFNITFEIQGETKQFTGKKM